MFLFKPLVLAKHGGIHAKLVEINGISLFIFVYWTNLAELSFAKVGPHLILMGFVATTLSICEDTT